MTVHADSGFFAKEYNENADEEEKAAYREAFSGLLSSFANRFTSEIESDEAYDNYVTAFWGRSIRRRGLVGKDGGEGEVGADAQRGVRYGV